MLKSKLTYLWKQYSHSFDPEGTIEACRPAYAIGPVIVFCGFILLVDFIPDIQSKIQLDEPWPPFGFFIIGGVFTSLSWRFGRNNLNTLAILQLLETIFYSLAFLFLAAHTPTPQSYAFATIYILMLLYWGTHYGFSVIGFLGMVTPSAILISLGMIEDLTSMMVATGIIFFISASSLTASRRSRENQTGRTADIFKQLENLISVQQKITGKNTNARVVSMIHNLKNDLLPCYLDLEELQEQIQEPETIQTVQRTLLDIKKIVSDLETYLKQIEFEKQDDLWFPIDELVEELEALLPKEMESGIVQISAMPSAFADGHVNSIALAFRNLVENAIEAGATKVHIEASTTKRSNTIQFTISDNGPGLPATIRDRLFKPYNSHGKPHGVGLGIYLASQILLANRGQLSLEESTKNGTIFTVELCEVETSSS